MFSVLAFGWLISTSIEVEATTGSWATLPMNVQPYLSEDIFNYATVPILFGTPPQQVNLTVDLSADLLAAYAYDCVLCAGTTFFDPELSSTYKALGTPWGNSLPTFNGIEVNDTIDFAGILEVQNRNFVLIKDGSDPDISARIYNGHLGLFLSPLSSTSVSKHILSQLHASSSLLNPVIGMRFDSGNPKITIGALDPNDYEGEINWVEMDTQLDPHGDYLNTFKLDGLKGYDGSFVALGGNNLTAALDSLFMSISIPNTTPYFTNPAHTGPTPQIALDPIFGLIEYECDTSPTKPYVALSASINGVDYQIDSADNLLRPQFGFSITGYCPVGIRNRTDTTTPDVVFGQPFLRSVYIAYRFPTDDCPGYYGFAFPTGSNRTESQVSQTPTSTPANSAQCLSLTTPTSTPTPFANVVLAQDARASKERFGVYGRPGAGEVTLLGVDEIQKMVWNWTDLS
ncbi:hypothetical protein HYDPIDRAFT_184012 [Hydnomerulius pinastri MD-312]|uniref:Unplaced genomic scaffold scaffold_54, whole genome shotgun sequence n=1 Tax=Hydnomerulius pinastri MD-312 TaxID=994086 RepID=A0A0C9W9A9_9AGAM|nr:hypothetical protein HYDPIDRAFT_184012 [Hydnomerulius pinastri MD-312]